MEPHIPKYPLLKGWRSESIHTHLYSAILYYRSPAILFKITKNLIPVSKDLPACNSVITFYQYHTTKGLELAQVR